MAACGSAIGPHSSIACRSGVKTSCMPAASGSGARSDQVPSAPGVAVLRGGHSHNDYTRERPLLDALDKRYMSVEADVYLVDGELLVAHDRRDCRKDRTLRGMYLEPLAARVRAGRRVYPDAPVGTPPLVLLIDIKTEGRAAYAEIDRQLAGYPDVFTSCVGVAVSTRAVTVIISGDVPREAIAAQGERRAFIDGREGDLEGPAAAALPPSLVPMVSLPWTPRFAWIGLGAMPTVQRAELRRLVAAAHGRGYRIRFWGTPNLPAFWKVLVEEGVDVIGVDDLDLGRGALAPVVPERSR